MPAPAPGLDPSIRPRVRRLLETYFANEDERTRRAILNKAFDGCERRPSIQFYSGSEAVFADHVLETLLNHGCCARGRHSLSLLMESMARARGRQTDPDFAELPRLLDQDCALPTREEELHYLRVLIDREEEIARLYSPLQAIAQSLPGKRVAPLLAPWRCHKDIALLLHQPRSRDTQEAERQAATRPYDDILAAFAEVKQAALLGAPGSGKSTTLRKLAVDIARRALDDPNAPLPLIAGLGFWTGGEELATFLRTQVPDMGWAATALAEQGQGRLILLLDGLNEVPTAQRQVKAGQIEAYRQGLPKRTPILVSCRRDDYVGDLRLEMDSLSLEPLSPPRVRAVLQHWLSQDSEHLAPGSADRLFWQLAGDDDQRLAPVLETWLATGRGEEAFWTLSDPWAEDIPAEIDWDGRGIWRRCVQDPRSLLRLAANPFMLTMLYVTWLQNEGRLPRNRGELFEQFTESLLSREGLVRTDPDSGNLHRDARADLMLDGLANVAWRMQGERWRKDETLSEDFGVLTVLPRADVVGLLEAKPAVQGEALLKIAEDATLLEGRDEIRFRHQLLQEYFTAIALKQHLVSGGLEADLLWPQERWWERSGWEEAAVLLAGLYSDDCTPVIRWLKDQQPEVAAQCILESGAALADPDALYRDLHDAWLPRLTDIDREPAPEARAAVGRALARLGLDDRKGVGLTPEGLPDIDWIEIPGGDFIYQEGELLTCEAFRIARYPVTHAQFQAFLDAGDGYSDDRWWADFDAPDRNPAPARWPIANHPREGVSWFEAMAFCAWLSDRLGEEIRLTTEWQWERAARGTDGRAYPWGSDYRARYANIDETNDDAGPHVLGQTSAVGIYPQGASPEGVMDLSGNVWEWCLNEYGNPQGVGPEGSVPRVVRGGSWFFFRDGARAADRDYGRPGDRDDDLGFRVVCASPIR